MIRTRFSPSPTGMIHIGNARTALFSALYAKKQDGIFILRIEDTDVARSENKFIESLKHDLHWLGIHWQEGPDIDTDFGPYFQSKRHHLYESYYEKLIEKNLAYPCFCTDQELLLNRKLQLSRGQAPKYPGTCRELSKEELQKRFEKGLKPALRFRVPGNTIVEFVDLVKGPQKFNADDIGDFIIRRADGSSSFMFCNAIDDALMKVSHVLRGEDHLANTPRQLMILNALGLSHPHYGHLSLITGDDGAPLSKRHGSFSVHDFYNRGFLPIALINYLARLSHTMDDQNLLTFDELAKKFQIEKISRGASRFDENQLLFWQKTAVMSLNDEALWQWLGSDITTQIPVEFKNDFIALSRNNILFPLDAKKWADILFKDSIQFNESQLLLLKSSPENFFQIAENAVLEHGIDIKKILDHIKTTTGCSGKNLFMPIRIALTGEQHGPELAQIVQMLGKEKMLARFKKVASA